MKKAFSLECTERRLGRLVSALLLAGLAGCAAAPEAAPPPPEASAGPDLRTRQERACAAATAEHIGSGLEAVAPAWRDEAEDGTATVEVRDGDRLHVCEVDASARPLRLLHPAA